MNEYSIQWNHARNQKTEDVNKHVPTMEPKQCVHVQYLTTNLLMMVYPVIKFIHVIGLTKGDVQIDVRRTDLMPDVLVTRGAN